MIRFGVAMEDDNESPVVTTDVPSDGDSSTVANGTILASSDTSEATEEDENSSVPQTDLSPEPGTGDDSNEKGEMVPGETPEPVANEDEEGEDLNPDSEFNEEAMEELGDLEEMEEGEGFDTDDESPV